MLRFLRKKTSPLFLAVWFVFSLLSTQRLLAQIDTGRVVGTILDVSGGVVPGAKVTLTNEGTGLVEITTSGPTGNYVFTPVKVGVYTVAVELKGFQQVSTTHLSLHVQENLEVDFKLKPGRLTQTTEVVAAAQVLQTQEASVGQTVGTAVVNDLPLNGRNWTQLAQLSAGVTVSQNHAPQDGYFSANGVSVLQNDYRLNGINDNNEMYFYLTPYAALPPPDAIQEFKVQTGNYNAEFGHSAGGVVNATTKSGTNRFHGDTWEFLRNSNLDAAQFFENASGIAKGAFRMNQFGATLGGPVWIPHVYNGKNKTFFFVDYQGTRIRQATSFTSTVPTASMRSSGYTDLQDLITYQGGTRTDDLGRTFPLGTVFDPATTRAVTAGAVDPVTDLTATADGIVRDPFYQGSAVKVTNYTSASAEALLNLLPSARLDQNAIKLLNLYPAPVLSNVLYNNYTRNPSVQDDTNQFDIRIDHNFSAKNQLFGSMSWSHEANVNPGPLPGLADGDYYYQGAQTKRRQAYALSDTHSFSSTLVNEARFGYNRAPGSQLNTEANTLGIPAQFGIQGIPQVANNGGLPEIDIAGMTSLGTSGWVPTALITQVYEVSDNLAKVYGGHTFKGGFQFSHVRGGIAQPAFGHGDFDFGGVYTGIPNVSGGDTGPAQLLLTPIASSVANGFNDVGGVDYLEASRFASTDDSRNYTAAYFQDDWMVTKKLTLNLGMRWDYYTPYREVYGAQGNFIPASPGNGAAYVITPRHCHDTFSTSFTALTATDGIDVRCGDMTLGNAQSTNFGPRFGFAYRATSRAVVRGGYGIFYGALGNIGYGPNLGNNYPFVFNLSYNYPDAAHPLTLPNGENATLEAGLSGVNLSPVAVNAQGLGLNGRQINYQTPYSQSYNLTVQYQLSPNQTLQLGYVGTLGRHLDISAQTNSTDLILPPGNNPQNYVPFPDFARDTTYETTNANSFYNGLQATLERRFSGGLSLLANYTYSKCRSDYENLAAEGHAASYRAPYLPGFGIQADYELCEADVREIAHIAGSYQLPFGAGKKFLGGSKGVVNQIIGGWATNWILSEQDGQPFTVGCPVATTAEFGCNALLVPGQNVYAGPHNVNQWLNPDAFAQPPVATAIGQKDYSPLGGAPTQANGPGIHRLDLSLFKQFPISESTRLEFRAEVFNLTNTPMFGYPGQLDFLNPVQFSSITSVRDGAYDPRQIQFALKLYW